MLLLSRTAFLATAIRMPTSFHRFSTRPNKIVFLGTPDVSALCLEILSKNTEALNYEIVGVVTQPPTPSGRSLAVKKSPVHKLAEALSIPIYCPVKANESDFIQTMSEIDIDLCITAAYGNYLPKSFLKLPRFGTVNIHPSLLPRYRGASPVQSCLLAGDRTTGVTVLFSVAKMDAGPILGQVDYALTGEENASVLLPNLFKKGTELLLELLPNILTGCANSTIQDEKEATLAPKISAIDSLVDLTEFTATEVHNRVLAYSEWPGTHCILRFENNDQPPVRVKLLTTAVIQGETDSRQPSSLEVTMTNLRTVTV